MKITRSVDIQSSIDISEKTMMSYYLGNGLDWKPEEYSKALSSSEHFHILINDEMVGFFAYAFNNEELFLLDMQILTSFQSKGIGAKIIQYLNVVCTEKNMLSIGLAVFKSNKQAFEFYSKHQFQVVEVHEINYVMRKILLIE